MKRLIEKFIRFKRTEGTRGIEREREREGGERAREREREVIRVAITSFHELKLNILDIVLCF